MSVVNLILTITLVIVLSKIFICLVFNDQNTLVAQNGVYIDNYVPSVQ